MRLIERDFYLNKLKDVMGTPDIKVITGVRRSGKSKLLESFMAYVWENEPEVNIIHVNFNLNVYENLTEYHVLHDYIENAYLPDKNNFVFIDEVQMCSGFEKAINSLHASEKYDIYITGSNAFLLSSDLATLFTGRTFEIEVFPFSFGEFMRYFELTDPYVAFNRYIQEGGMSGSYLYKTQESKYDYISDVFNTLIVRDIQRKYGIRNMPLMERLCDSIERLPEQMKVVFKKCFLDGRKYQEAADELDISVNTVKTHVRKALRMLRCEFSAEQLILYVSLYKSSM